MNLRVLRRLLPALVLAPMLAGATTEVRVNNATEFRRAVGEAQPGTHILLAPGTYGGGFHFSNLRGTAAEPIVIAAADPKDPPVFRGAKTGLQLSNPAHLELRDLAFTQLSDNGLNLDDGGAAHSRGPEGAHHLVLRGIRSTDIGADGNQDGIKLSGLWDFEVTGCTIERWGTGGGSAIDLVGCHRGLIAGNTIRHQDPPPANCTGVQIKGGSSAIAVRQNRFESAGGRAVNIGGSTGLEFFRPALAGETEHAEARDVRVEGNLFHGGVTPVAFVGVDGAVVRFNTIEQPARWALRILQENRAPGFIACRNGVFSDNLVVFDSAHWAEGGVNIGPATAPETFTFARNAWYCADRPERSTPKLPTPETDGIHGRLPADVRSRVGAGAWQP